jgi:hypothetical protein
VVHLVKEVPEVYVHNMPVTFMDVLMRLLQGLVGVAVCFRCAASSSTGIPSAPAEPLLASTCVHAWSMLPRRSAFPVIFTAALLVISAPLKARLAGPPCRI